MSITTSKRRLQGAKYADAVFVNLDLSSTSAYGSTWNKCEFRDCDLSLSTFQTAEFVDCLFVNCDLRMSNFGLSRLRHVRFEECNIRQSNFAGSAPLDDVAFEDCALHYSSFFDATVRNLAFPGSNLHGADLRFIEASDVDFSGAVLWGSQIQLGCQIFRQKFDERSVDMFAALLARVHPDPVKAQVLKDLSGTMHRVAAKLMDAAESA